MQLKKSKSKGRYHIIIIHLSFLKLFTKDSGYIFIQNIIEQEVHFIKINVITAAIKLVI